MRRAISDDRPYRDSYRFDHFLSGGLGTQEVFAAHIFQKKGVNTDCRGALDGRTYKRRLGGFLDPIEGSTRPSLEALFLDHGLHDLALSTPLRAAVILGIVQIFQRTALYQLFREGFWPYHSLDSVLDQPSNK